MGRGGALDARVFRMLYQDRAFTPTHPDVRRSLALIAKQLGVNEGTIRNRIRRFRETGFVEQERLILNPTLTGHGTVEVFGDLAPQASQEEVVRSFRLVEGVFIVNLLHEGRFAVVCLHRGEPALARQVELIRRFAGARTVTVGRLPFPRCSINLSRTDRAVLRALVRNPRRPYASVAKESNLSSRTVKRRLDRLVRANAVFVLPQLNPAGLQGAVLAALVVQYDADSKADVDRHVMTQFDDYLCHVTHMLPYHPGEPLNCAYLLLFPNVPRGREVLDEVRRLPGVRAGRIDLFDAIHTFYEPFEQDLGGGDGVTDPTPADEGDGTPAGHTERTAGGARALHR